MPEQSYGFPKTLPYHPYWFGQIAIIADDDCNIEEPIKRIHQ